MLLCCNTVHMAAVTICKHSDVTVTPGISYRWPPDLKTCIIIIFFQFDELEVQ